MEKFENLLIDFYELTMGQAYFNKNTHDDVAYFDLFFRKCPDNASLSKHAQNHYLPLLAQNKTNCIGH